MANGTVQRSNDASGLLIDTEELSVGGKTVERQRIEVTGSAAAAIADVVNTDPAVGSTAYGLAIRLAGRTPEPYCNGQTTMTSVTLNSATATLLPATSAANRRFVQVINQDATPILLGDSQVASNGGIPIAAGTASDWLPLGPAALIYGLSLAPNATVLVWELADA